MPRKGVGWPSVGQLSQDANEHSTILIDEARKLLKYGAPSEESSSGKQCPYQTLANFCTSVVAYMENTPQPTLPSRPQGSLSLQVPGSGEGSVSTLGQDIADFNAKDNTVGPKLAAPETYGVLILYVPTNFDVANQEKAINGIINVNKGFMPGLEIKSIEWLIPEWTKTKHYGSLLVEFTHPEHANAAIREQLLVGGKVLACEYYERNSRLRQCKTCQQYGHLEAQCISAPACGRCAERHVTADCRKRENPKMFRCAICQGPHRAWDNVCNIRQDELDSVRLARANRPEYHTEPGSNPIDDVQSRDFAGTRRYSVDYLIEINLRGGRKSHANLRGRGGRGQGMPPNFRENPEFREQESTLFPGKSTRNSWGRNGRAPFDFDGYTAQAGCLQVKPEVQPNWGGDGSTQGQNFGWGQSGMLTIDPDQSRKAPGAPRRAFASGNSVEPLRPRALERARRQITDGWRWEQ